VAREKFLIALARLYFIFLFGWLVLRFLFGDRWALLFLFNTFAEFLFLPLIPITLVAWKFRARDLALGSVIAIVAATILFGEMFAPKISPMTATPTLRVMTYNMLGHTNHADAVVATIRESDADVIAIQELNPNAADALQRDLLREYPYQILDPHDGVAGLGVISRYPLRLSTDTLPGRWIGAPQLLQLDWQGTPVTILHVHTIPTTAFIDFIRIPQSIEASIRNREENMRALAAYVAAHRDEPIIGTGDFNMTDQNTSYRIIASELRDTWREAGWGLGHTFPSTNLNAMPLPSLANSSPFMWLVRIDYIFHSSHWRAVSADLGNWDGQSDHRPVIVRLVLEE
jgi:endonuclease/exonuclease/phosphatase (EEP) superfamily protein YafD